MHCPSFCLCCCTSGVRQVQPICISSGESLDCSGLSTNSLDRAEENALLLGNWRIRRQLRKIICQYLSLQFLFQLFDGCNCNLQPSGYNRAVCILWRETTSVIQKAGIDEPGVTIGFSAEGRAVLLIGSMLFTDCMVWYKGRQSAVAGRNYNTSHQLNMDTCNRSSNKALYTSFFHWQSS